MNILTKISVVVLVVLVLFASAVMIAISVVPQNYRTAYLNEKASNELANTAAVNAMLAQRATEQQLLTANNQLAALKTGSAGEIEALKGQLVTAQADNTVLKTNVAAINANLLKNNGLVEVAQTQAKTAETNMAKLRADLDDLNKRNTELASQLTRIQGDLVAAEQQNRSKNVEIQGYKEQITKLMNQLAEVAPNRAKEAMAAPVTTATPDVTGRVNGVKENLVSVNIGSAKGIKEGMKLTISRSGKLVGSLIVQRADLGESAGVLTDKQMDPQINDTVRPASNQ